ncbi:hypothetical protein H5410_005445 [Solanum commersonii]|uniref:Uncharacterized protein n=1 Tax=Solanum commersonii TaxID=4109 RepID=A0A9J6A7G2_SOLCO|nr:hypothetical protein H5410_005445 [Solanum commersonii]
MAWIDWQCLQCIVRFLRSMSSCFSSRKRKEEIATTKEVENKSDVCRGLKDEPDKESKGDDEHNESDMASGLIRNSCIYLNFRL